MASSGPLYPSTVTGNTGSGTDWAGTTNLGSDNGSYATATDIIGLGGTSKNLIATNFGFSVPAGSTINGIVVEVDRKASTGTTLTDLRVQLMSAGSLVGNNKATVVQYGTTDQTVPYGGTSDVWGWSPTASLINASTFGVQFAVTATSFMATASVDFIRITVHYTPAATGCNVTTLGV